MSSLFSNVIDDNSFPLTLKTSPSSNFENSQELSMSHNPPFRYNSARSDSLFRNDRSKDSITSSSSKTSPAGVVVARDKFVSSPFALTSFPDSNVSLKKKLDSSMPPSALSRPPSGKLTSSITADDINLKNKDFGDRSKSTVILYPNLNENSMRYQSADDYIFNQHFNVAKMRRQGRLHIAQNPYELRINELPHQISNTDLLNSRLSQDKVNKLINENIYKINQKKTFNKESNKILFKPKNARTIRPPPQLSSENIKYLERGVFGNSKKRFLGGLFGGLSSIFTPPRIDQNVKFETRISNEYELKRSIEIQNKAITDFLINVCKTTTTNITQLQSYSFLNLNALQDITLDLNLNQEIEVFDTTKLDVTAVSTVVQELSAQVLSQIRQNFDNATLNDLINASKVSTENNLMNSTLQSILGTPAPNNTQLSQIINVSSELSNAINMEFNTALGNMTQTNMTAQILNEFNALFQQEMSVFVSNLTANNITINLSTSQTAGVVLQVVNKINFQGKILNKLNSSDILSADTELINKVENISKNTGSNETENETVSSVISSVFKGPVIILVVAVIFVGFILLKWVGRGGADDIVKEGSKLGSEALAAKTMGMSKSGSNTNTSSSNPQLKLGMGSNDDESITFASSGGIIETSVFTAV